MSKLAWVVFRKELRETLRDRRTLIVMLLVPVLLYPLLGLAAAEWSTSYLRAHETRRTRVEIRSAAADRALAAKAFVKSPDIEMVDRDGDVIVELAAGVARVMDEGGTARVVLRFDAVDDRAQIGVSRVRKALEAEAVRVRDERMRARDVPLTLVEPLQILEVSTATAQQAALAAAGRMLPLFLLLMVAAGALYPAIDLTAGEKERGTLETLLAAPVSRRDVVVGKYLTVTTVAFVVALVHLTSLGLTAAVAFRGAGPAASALSVPWGRAFAIVPAAFLAAAFFSALMMTVACMARSFKDAQNVMAPVYLGLLLPSVIAQSPGSTLDYAMALAPGVNVALLLRAAFEGSARIGPVLLTIFVCVSSAALALAFAERLYRGESLLLGGEQSRVRTWRSAASPGEGLLVVAGVFLLLLYVGQRLQAAHFVIGTIVTEWLLVLGPVLLIARARKLDWYALGLQRPSPQAMAGALLCGAGAWALAGALVQFLQERVIPMPPEFVAHMRALLFPQPLRPLAVDFLALAIGPAVCEELLFRGLLLRSTIGSLGPWRAALLNALLFGLFHFSLYRFLPTAALGLLLATLAIRTGSVVPGILFHALHNGAALIAGRILGPDVAMGNESPPLWLVGLGTAVVGAGLWLAGKGTIQRSTLQSR